jgi:hypothetical protein
MQIFPKAEDRGRPGHAGIATEGHGYRLTLATPSRGPWRNMPS